MSGLAANACGARVVIPAQAEIIQPPDLGCGCDSDIDSNRVEVLELVAQGNPCKGTIAESGTSWDSDALGDYCSSVASAGIISETSEMEVAVGASGIATKRRTVHIEAEATSETVITIADVT